MDRSKPSSGSLAADRARFERTTNTDSGISFEITERDANGNPVRAGLRAEYYPVTFLEPLAGNAAALGFDLGSNAARLEALDLARDTGGLTVTQRIRLVQETTADQFGFLAFQAIYLDGAPNDTVDQRRDALVGFSLGVYRVPQIMAAALEGREDRRVDVGLLDSSAPLGEQALAALTYMDDEPAVSNPERVATLAGSFRAEKRITVGNRTWTAVVSSAPGFGTPNSPLTWSILGGGLIISALLAALLLALAKRASRTATLLALRAEQAGLLAEREQLVERLFNSQEEERRRVAREMHDGPAQQLAGVSMFLEGFQAGRENEESPETEGYLRRAAQYAATALTETRRIISGLRPTDLDDLGLRQALKNLVGDQGEGGTEIEFTSDLDGSQLDPTTEMVLYRVAQESLTNALKHSGSSRVRVDLGCQGTEIVLRVQD